jgi:hypothetical protein
MTDLKLPHRRQFLHLAAGAAALPVVSRGARAQAYPSRPVTIIVPFAAGGATDVAARIIGEYMSRALGQSIIIENIAGAGGTTGSIRAMRARPDGHTILMAHIGTHAFSVSLYPNLAYKPGVDFEPIGLVFETPYSIVARKDFPPRDLKEFVAYVKANGEKLNVSHAGVGSITFTFSLLLNTPLGVKPTMVPYNVLRPLLMHCSLGKSTTCVTVSRKSVSRFKLGSSRHMESGPPNVTLSCRMFRLRRKLACRNFREWLGFPCLRRRACRNPFLTGLPIRLTGHSTTTTCASAYLISATFQARQSEVSIHSAPW